jgi:hypothetical protein
MPKLQIVLAFTFGVAFTAILLVLAVLIPHPTKEQFEIFRIVIAVSVAGIAATVPGLLQLKLNQGAVFSLRAGGALAVFVVVYFYSPAHWVSSPQPVAVTFGQCSPIVSDADGNVVINSECSTDTENKHIASEAQ